MFLTALRPLVDFARRPVTRRASLGVLTTSLLLTVSVAVASARTDLTGTRTSGVKSESAVARDARPTTKEQRWPPSIYYSVDPNTTVYSPNLQVVVSICSEDGIISSDVTSSRGDVQPDAWPECESGENGLAYFITWSVADGDGMLVGANDITVSACTGWPSSDCEYGQTQYWYYALPEDNSIYFNIGAPVQTIELGKYDTIGAGLKNSEYVAKTYNFSNNTKCVPGLGTCTVLTPSVTVPAATGPKNPGKASVKVRVRGNELGSGSVKIIGCRPVGWGETCVQDEAEYSILPPAPVAAAVTVTPGATAANKGSGAQFSLSFLVKNTGSATTTFALHPSCDPAVIASGCTASAASLTLASNVTATVSFAQLVSATQGSLTTGVVSLTATGGVAEATGQTAVTVGPNGGTGGAPVIAVQTQGINPAGSIARDQCLMFAAGDAAGVECGDLRLAHGLPTIRTMGQARAPTLLYSSRHASPVQLINANVTVLRAAPTTVTTTLTIPNETPIVRTYSWPSNCANVDCRIVVPVNAETLGLATGWYPYILEVKMALGATVYTDAVAGNLAIVNRTTSPFGRGWWLEGLEQIVHLADATRKLWVGGDGSTRIYKKSSVDSTSSVDTTYFVSEYAVSRPDTLLAVHQSSPYWLRRLPNGAYVRFDNTGRHTKTVNAMGHGTSLYYSSGRLDSLLLPVPAGSAARPRYGFHYASTGSAVLDSVVTRGASGPTLKTAITRSGTWRIASILDPGDATAVVFASDTTTGRITSRRTRRLDYVNFTYDQFGAVTKTTVKMTNPSDADIVTDFCATETRSLVSCSWAATTVGGVRLPDVVTKVNGPRTGTIDVMTFHLNRFGGPDSIQDPLGGRTRMERAGPFPVLVTKVTDAAGQVQRAWYNSRGLADSVRVDNPLGTTADATTRIKWHDKWALPDTIFPVVGAATAFNYSSTLARLNWQQRGPSSSTRVTFGYDANSNQVLSVSQPGADESFGYDPVLGNIDTMEVADQVTVLARNAFGFETTVADGDGLLTETIFRGPLGRVDSTLAVSATLARPLQTGSDSLSQYWNTVPSRGRKVVNTYDAEGNLTSVTPKAVEAKFSEATAQVSWTYDAARRVRTRSVVIGVDSFFYDPAGLEIKRRTARGHVITKQYDALGRLTARVIPGIRAAQQTCGSCAGIPGAPLSVVKMPYFATTVRGGGSTTDLVLPADVEIFTYDAAGRLLTADNHDARVSRTYYPGGALKSDTLRIRRWDQTDTLPNAWNIGHTYSQTFEADIAGRRTKRVSSYAAGGSWQQTYTYDPVYGRLSGTDQRSVSGGSAIAYSFTWNAAGQPLQRQVLGAPLEISETRSYDTDGRLETRTEKGHNLYGPGVVFEDSYEYDARGKQVKRITYSPDFTLKDSSAMAYDGFGALVALTRWRDYGTLNKFTDEYDVDGLGNVWGAHMNRFSHIGRSLSNNVYNVGRLQYQQPDPLSHVRGDNSALPAVTSLDTAQYGFDAAGNQTFMVQRHMEYHYTDQFGEDQFWRPRTGSVYTFQFYDAAERLRISQRTRETGGPWVTQLDHRYDALGRRILTRTRTDSTTCSTASSGNTQPCLATMERFVWDGDQLLLEIRGGGHYTMTETELEMGAGTGAWFGTVRYMHALGIDDPVAVRRSGHDAFVPHRSGRGGYEGGTYLDNEEMDDYHWPQRTSGVYLGADVRITPPTPMGWFGSLLDGKTDASGLQYMRNRYYDPASGRFTQRDPIGLAGGINLYGYAAGDPINNSDPLGLSPETLTVVGEDLQKSITEERKNPRADSAFTALEQSADHFLLFDSDAAGCGAVDCGFGGWSWDRNDSVGIPPEIQAMFPGNYRGISHVRPTHASTRQTGVGGTAWHEAVHQWGIVTRGRKYGHGSGTACDAAFVGIPGGCSP